MRDHRVHEPTTAEAQKWLTLASQALNIANGKSKGWRDLRSALKETWQARVFGQISQTNVCILLREVVVRALADPSPEAHFGEMARLADDVRRRYEAWAAVRAAQSRAGGA